MKLRKAASIGCILITVHIVMNACLSTGYIIQMLPTIRQGLHWSFIMTPLYFLATIILDIALLIVFISLTRTKEKLIRDSTPDL